MEACDIIERKPVMKKRTKIPKVAAQSTPAVKPTPPPTRAAVESMLFEYLDSEITFRGEDFAKWKADNLKDRDRHDLEWADGFCRTVCMLEVYKEVREALTPPTLATVATVTDYAIDKVIDLARFTSHSSSYMMNFMHRMRLEAWGDIAHNLRGWCRACEKADADYARPDQVPAHNHVSCVIQPAGSGCPGCEHHWATTVSTNDEEPADSNARE